MNFFNGKILNIVLSKTVRFIKNSPIPQTSLEYMSRNKNVIEALKSTSARQGVPQVCVLLTIVREDEGKAAAVVWGNLRWGVWGRSSAELPPGPDTSVAASRADERGARPANREKSDFLTGSEGVAADTDAKADASEGAVGKWQAVQPEEEQKLDKAGSTSSPGAWPEETWRASACGRASPPPRGCRRASTDRCAASRLEARAAPSFGIDWTDVVTYDSVWQGLA